MATTKPRITITLEPEQHEILRRLADLQGTSMSKIVTDFLGEVTPVLLNVADTLEAAQRASLEARAKFVRTAEIAEEELRPLAEFARDQFNLFAGEIDRLEKEVSPRPVITGATESQRRAGKSKRRTDAATLTGASQGGK